MGKRRWGRRLAGLVVLMVLLELALQAAGPLVQRAMLRRDPDPSPDAPLTILCVGDSNTYGLHMPRVFAYPALLQGLLEQRFHQPVTVANRGVPGQNTAQVLAALPDDLAATHADLVLVLCGINDAWNTGAEERGFRGLIEQLKLVRLVRVLLSGVTTASPFEIRSDDKGEIVVDRGRGAERVNGASGGSAVRTGDELARQVRAGLAAIVERCADAGAVPVLMTYAEYQGDFATVNATARDLAAELHLLLVDHERAFGERFRAEGYDALMMNDHHPNLRGYQLMAEQVDDALTAAGWVPPAGAPAAAREPGASGAPEAADDAAAGVPATLARLAGDRLAIGGPPRVAFQVLMSHRPGPDEGFGEGALRVHLASDRLTILSRLEPSFSGRLDAQGRAELAIPPRLRAGAGAEGLAACVLLLRDPGGAPSAGNSPLLGVSATLILDD